MTRILDAKSTHLEDDLGGPEILLNSHTRTRTMEPRSSTVAQYNA